jgi:hypothetical protein
MPTRRSTRVEKWRKHKRMTRSSKVFSEDSFIQEETLRIQKERRLLKVQKELSRQENERLKLMHFERIKERHSSRRVNAWTGLRFPPEDNVEGRNWTFYYCSMRFHEKFPKNVVSTIVNEFLNWIPAGCWNKPGKGCTECGISVTDKSFLGVKVCSHQCYELTLRKVIIDDYKFFAHSVLKVIHDPLFNYCEENGFDEEDIAYREDRIRRTIHLSNYHSGFNRIYYADTSERFRWFNNTPRMDRFYKLLDEADRTGREVYEMDSLKEYIEEFSPFIQIRMLYPEESDESESDDDSGEHDYPHPLSQEVIIHHIKMEFGLKEFNDDIWRIRMSH